MKKPAEMTKPLEMRKPVEMTKPVEKTKPVYMTQVPTVILRGALRRSRRIHGLSRCLPTLACARYHDRTERSKTAQNQISPFGRNHKAGRNDTTANRQSARIRSAQSLKFVRVGSDGASGVDLRVRPSGPTGLRTSRKSESPRRGRGSRARWERYAQRAPQA